MTKNKICVYTCITGNYDNLKEIIKEPGIDYYCFTNNKKLTSKSWKIVHIEDDNLSNVKLARKIKILGHELINNYDILLWMDAAVTFKKSIKEFIDYYLGNYSFVAFKHGARSTIKDECFECLKFGKESKDNIIKLLNFYEKEKFNDDYGLVESTVFIKRPNDKKVIDTMNLWFDMILKYSHRDQLSFNYCISKTKLDVRWIDEKVFDNEWFAWIKHNTDRKITKYRLYFGDESNFNLDCDLQGNYIIDDNYVIDTKIPCDSDKLVICPCHVLSTYFNELKINDSIISDYELRSVIDFNGKSVFYDENPFIIVNSHFKKGERIKIEINMKVMDDVEISEFAFFLANELNLEKINSYKEIKERDKIISSLNKTLNGITSSFSWKLLSPIRKIFK